MLDFIKQHVSQLLDSVVAPIWAWVLARSWGVRATILAALLLSTGIVCKPQTAMAMYANAIAYTRAVTAGPRSIPIDSAVRDGLEGLRSRLTTSILSDISTYNDGHLTPWSAAQAVVSLPTNRIDYVTKLNLIEYIRSNRAASDCFCWTEVPTTYSGELLFVSGWVMKAYAQLGVPLTDRELDDILSKQDDSGWWALYADADQYQYASTYSTAWIIFGLYEQQSRGLISKKYEFRVKSAIARGGAWLMQARDSNGLWKAYPYLSNSRESISISGLDLHVLHIIGAEGLLELDRKWINTITGKDISVNDGEIWNLDTYSRSSRLQRVDHFTYIKLPWTIAASVDAYSSGTVLEKGRILLWLDRELGSDDVKAADSAKSNWWRAELLYSLSEILDKHS